MTILALSILLTLNLFVGLHGNDVRESTNIETPDILNQEENMDVRFANYEDYLEEGVDEMILELMILSPPDVLAEDADKIRKAPPPETFMPHFEEHGSVVKNFLAFLWAWFKLTSFLTTYTMVMFYTIALIFHRNIEDH